MATNQRLTLTGMDDVLRALKKAPEVVRKHAASAVGRSVITLANLTRAITPVGPTGELQRSITYYHTDGRLTGWVGVADGSPARGYWFMVEFGNKRAAAQPFFRPAAESYQSTFIGELRDIGPDIELEMGE